MRTTYKTLCTVFNQFMLHDYMVCYHVVLTVNSHVKVSLLAAALIKIPPKKQDKHEEGELKAI